MKANKAERPNRLGLKVVPGLLALLAAVAGLVFAGEKLRAVYIEQCVIADMKRQVAIDCVPGKMVQPGTIAEEFGLRVGANLACIDFAKKRRDLLARIPNLRAIQIARTLPDKVRITAEERTPIAKLALSGSRNPTGRVVDAEGVVFVWHRGTQTLPTICEPTPPGTQKGQRVAGRSLAALRLVEACRQPEFLELGVLEVDASRHDFLLATLGNYSKVKILWKEMDAATADSRADLERRLTQLRDVIRSRVAADAVIWNATIPDRIFADTQGKL